MPFRIDIRMSLGGVCFPMIIGIPLMFSAIFSFINLLVHAILSALMDSLEIPHQIYVYHVPVIVQYAEQVYLIV